MARRPYIETKKIKPEYKPVTSSNKPKKEIAVANNREVIGMDGKSDWFRANCRGCDKKLITKRKVKSPNYYQCKECKTWHFTPKGIFDIDRFETKPIKPHEVIGNLYCAKLDYAQSEFNQEEWHYGSKQQMNNIINADAWEVVEDMEIVK